jgi:hypothetical protein
MKEFNIDNELLSKLNGVKNECSDYLEELRKRKTIILNLNNEEDNSKSAVEFREWKIKNYKEMVKKSDDQLFSRKGDLILQLEELLTDLKK